ncbi:MAG: DUF971 domain-containing protein [Rhodobiaceae bacterium]|nr:DUF971 domain-containing protein [Rhodobiaceae bacterium]
MTNHSETSDQDRPWPTELRLSDQGRLLVVSFNDGRQFHLRAEYLRVESPSAEVQGHGTGQKKIVPHKKDVSIINIEPVGNYAARLLFSDGHDSGLFTWDYLHELGREHEGKWADYLAKLTETGLAR